MSTEYLLAMAASAERRPHLAEHGRKMRLALDAWQAGKMAKDKARAIVYAAAEQIDELTRPLTGAELREAAEWALVLEGAFA